jgi:hypothetical protein
MLQMVVQAARLRNRTAAAWGFTAAPHTTASIAGVYDHVQLWCLCRHWNQLHLLSKTLQHLCNVALLTASVEVALLRTCGYDHVQLGRLCGDRVELPAQHPLAAQALPWPSSAPARKV